MNQAIANESVIILQLYNICDTVFVVGLESGSLQVDYELRGIVEKVSVSSQEVVQRHTLEVHYVKPPTSIIEMGLRHAEQISLLEKVQNSVLAAQSKLIDIWLRQMS